MSLQRRASGARWLLRPHPLDQRADGNGPHGVGQQRRQDRPLPQDLTGAGLFHLGSFSQETLGGGFEVLYMNPTTSTRFNAFMPGFIKQLGLRAVGGKGGLDRACADAMREAGCVYLGFLGGGCPLLSDAIKSVVSVHWTDLIPHFRLVTVRVAAEQQLASPAALTEHFYREISRR